MTTMAEELIVIVGDLLQPTGIDDHNEEFDFLSDLTDGEFIGPHTHMNNS